MKILEQEIKYWLDITNTAKNPLLLRTACKELYRLRALRRKFWDLPKS